MFPTQDDLGKRITCQYGCGFFNGTLIAIGPMFLDDVPVLLCGRPEWSDDDQSYDLHTFWAENSCRIIP